MKHTTYFFFVIFTCIFSLSANASNSNNERGHRKSVFNSFANETLIKITLETDIDALIDNKFKDEYQTALIKYTDDNDHLKERKIKVKARGKYRNRVCDFPPLKIKFSKDELTSEGLSDLNKLKLVSHCFDTEDGSVPEQLMKEFLAYKTYNILSENSYQVKLALVTYKNLKTNVSFEQYAFLIESTEELAERIGRYQRKMYSLQRHELNKEEFGLLNVFQFMIGNKDWDLVSSKNLKAFPSFDNKEILLVPYDFDFAGFVDASYAALHPEQKQEGIRDRLCSEKFTDSASLESVLSRVEEKKVLILNMIEDFEYLDKGDKKDATSYIHAFYKLIENRKKAKDVFLYKPSDL